MYQLTLDIVNKIRNNCKHCGDGYTYTVEGDKIELSYWLINKYNSTENKFIQYSLIEEIYDNYITYNISIEAGADIEVGHEIATNEEVDDYNLEDWLNEYEEELETDEEVIRLVEEYLYCELRIENNGE